MGGWTPGPYEAVGLTIRQVASGCAIGRVLEDTETDAVTGGREEPLATADLWAAAPDLYEAAWAARSAIDEILGDSDLIHEADESLAFKACQMLSAALAKAEPRP